MIEPLYFSEAFVFYGIRGALVLTGLAALILLGLLMRDTLNKSIW